MSAVAATAGPVPAAATTDWTPCATPTTWAPTAACGPCRRAAPWRCSGARSATGSTPSTISIPSAAPRSCPEGWWARPGTIRRRDPVRGLADAQAAVRPAAAACPSTIPRSASPPGRSGRATGSSSSAGATPPRLAQHHPRINDRETGPKPAPASLGHVTLGSLSGYTVAITADRRHEEQAELVERRGGTVLSGPVIRTLPLADEAGLRLATERIVIPAARHRRALHRPRRARLDLRRREPRSRRPPCSTP